MSALPRQSSLQNLYPDIWKSYKDTYQNGHTIPADIWSFFHDLHLLQTAQSEVDITNVCWALGIFASSSKTAEDRQSSECAKLFIKGLRAREHEAWYMILHQSGNLELLLKSHPYEASLSRDHAAVAKSAVSIAVILMDFQSRWSHMPAWQREFLSKHLNPAITTVAFKEAQQVIDTLRPDAFTFLFARQLIRAGKGSLALQLLTESPSEKLAGVVECGSPREKHSYFELHSRFLKGCAEESTAYLKHLVKVEAYSDESLAIFLNNEDLKDVTFFIIQFVSLARRVYSGKATTENKRTKSSSASLCAALCGCCKSGKGVAHPSKSMLIKISNIPHVLLRGLLSKYEQHDRSGQEVLLHDKHYQNAMETVLLLNESEVAVRCVERLSETWVDFLRFTLMEWSRLHWLRILEQNRGSYEPEGKRLMRLLTTGEPWTWGATQDRNHYFKSDRRNSEDIAIVIWRFFEIGMFLDPTIIRQLITTAQHRQPSLDVLNTFLPVNSKIFDVVAGEVSKRSATLVGPEVKLLMRQPGFYDVGIQTFLKEGELERLRTVFYGNMGFARLMQVVARLFTFRDGQMDKLALESSLDQISTACQGDTTCLRLMTEVLDATLRKQDQDFLADGAGDVHADPSTFTVAGLASCARRLRVACDTVRNQPVQVTFGKVVGAFLETPPRGWVPLFNSLETVVFFLRFMEMEDLPQTYAEFAKENADVFKYDQSVFRLLQEAQSIYREPFINMRGNVTDLCNLDIRSKLEKVKLPPQKPQRQGPREGPKFGNNDWNLVVDIAACAAESMKEKYNVPMLPHHTQTVTLLMFAVQVCQGPGMSLPRTILARVGTGEGKSWIIGMLAAFVAKKGLTAHVIIDNQTLLERDFATMSSMFAKMNITAAKGKLNQNFQVVYCSAMDIELHFMDKMKDGIMDVNFRRTVMIVDEVDSLIVDENVYQCYVDDDAAGSELCEWWWSKGKSENKYAQEPWKKKIIEKLEVAEIEMQRKTEGKHYHVDERGFFWALDERTSVVKRSAWYLWLEIMRRQSFADYRMRYCSRQSVICQKSCFSSYSFIFGLTGSLGTDAEQEYFKKHFNASCFFVPAFLDTCRGTSRPRPSCLETLVCRDAQSQLAQTAALVRKHIGNVPILVVCKDAERVKKVVKVLQSALPNHVNGDTLGPGIIELLDRPGKETEFQQMVEVATQPLEAESGRQWRVTATTAIGARGQDYHISDELVDEKGGFLLILEYIPDSEREWIQFLGRTARHDHPGQYAVVSNSDDYYDVFGPSTPSDSGFVQKVLEHVNKVNEQKLYESEVQLERGVLMHKHSGHFWAWYKKNQGGSKESLLDKFGKWVDICDSFADKPPAEIQKAFDELRLPVMQSLPDPAGAFFHATSTTGREDSGGSWKGQGENYNKAESLKQIASVNRRPQPGDWHAGDKTTGEGRMVWPNGQVFQGKKQEVEFCSLFRDPL